MGSYLFANPSFLSGAARTLDLAGVFDEYNYSRTERIADALGLYNDWKAVGRDAAVVIAESLAERRAEVEEALARDGER